MGGIDCTLITLGNIELFNILSNFHDEVPTLCQFYDKSLASNEPLGPIQYQKQKYTSKRHRSTHTCHRTSMTPVQRDHSDTLSYLTEAVVTSASADNLPFRISQFTRYGNSNIRWNFDVEEKLRVSVQQQKGNQKIDWSTVEREVGVPADKCESKWRRLAKEKPTCDADEIQIEFCREDVDETQTEVSREEVDNNEMMNVNEEELIEAVLAIEKQSEEQQSQAQSQCGLFFPCKQQLSESQGEWASFKLEQSKGRVGFTLEEDEILQHLQTLPQFKKPNSQSTNIQFVHSMFIQIAKYNMKRIDDNDTLSFELYDRTLQQIKGRLNTKKNVIIKSCNQFK